jgi:Flp pilus assembly protein TadB
VSAAAAREASVRARSGRHDEPVLITEAQPSQEAQFRLRRRKYAIMMSTRTVCVILAAATYHTWWLLAIFIVGAAVLPWMAVIIANDRAPRKAKKVNRYAGRPDPHRALEAPAGERRVIDE